MPEGTRRKALLQGTEDVPTIAEHFSTTVRVTAQSVLGLLSIAVLVAVLYGLVSIAIALPTWLIVVVVILLLR